MTQYKILEPEGSAAPADAAAGPVSARAMLGAVMLAELACGITQGFLGPVLKRLYPVLHVTVADLNWVSIVNLLASVAFVPVIARLGDEYGRRRVLLWNMLLVATGSVVVGLSRSFGMLLAGSVLQASMTGFFPLLAGILREHGDPAGTRRSLGMMVTSLVAGLGVGTLASGLVAHAFARPTAALWVPAVGMIPALAVSRLLPPDSPGERNTAPGRPALTPGVVLCAGLAAVMLAIAKGGASGWDWGTTRTLGTLSGGLLLVAGWGIGASRSRRPMVDLRLLRGRGAAVVGLVAVAFSFCMIGPVIPDAVFLGTSARESGYGLGFTPLATSFALLPNLAALAVGAFGARRLAARLGDRGMLAAGSALTAAGYLGALAGHQSRSGFLCALAVVGLGCGVLQYATRTLAVEAAAPESTSMGSGINEVFITVGGSLGSAVVLAILASYTEVGHALPSFGAYASCWLLCAGVSLAGAIVSLAYRRT